MSETLKKHNDALRAAVVKDCCLQILTFMRAVSDSKNGRKPEVTEKHKRALELLLPVVKNKLDKTLFAKFLLNKNDFDSRNFDFDNPLNTTEGMCTMDWMRVFGLINHGTSYRAFNNTLKAYRTLWIQLVAELNKELVAIAAIVNKETEHV